MKIIILKNVIILPLGFPHTHRFTTRTTNISKTTAHTDPIDDNTGMSDGEGVMEADVGGGVVV